MGTFIAAYLVVWLGVTWYVLRLGAAQRRLQRAIDALQDQAVQAERVDRSQTRAA